MNNDHPSQPDPLNNTSEKTQPEPGLRPDNPPALEASDPLKLSGGHLGATDGPIPVVKQSAGGPVPPASYKSKKVRISSSKCLDRHPAAKKKPKLSDIDTDPCARWAAVSAARYDDIAMFAAREGLTSQFILVNDGLLSEWWAFPQLGRIFDAISAQMLVNPTTNTGTFARLLTQKDVRLLVAIVASVTDVFPRNLTVEDPRSAFAGEQVPYRSVPIILSATRNASERELCLTDERWEIGCRKFKVMKHVVSGPYLVIAAVDNPSGLTLRARIFPVWLAPDRSTFAIVRSNYERIGMQCVYENGGVAFTPIHQEQLSQLQLGLGHRWAGDLSTYPSLADMVICPKVGGKIVVLEIYGLCSFKNYEEGRQNKQVKIELVLPRNDWRYLYILTKHLNKKALPAPTVIKRLIWEWFSEEPRFLWANRP